MKLFLLAVYAAFCSAITGLVWARAAPARDRARTASWQRFKSWVFLCMLFYFSGFADRAPVYPAALHHEDHAPDGGDVTEGVAIYRDEVGLQARRHGPDLVGHAEGFGGH